MSDVVYFVPISYSSMFSSMAFVIVLFICFTLFINYIYVTVNFEKYKNNPNIISLAWAFGKDPSDLLNNYVTKTQDDIITKEFSKVKTTLDIMDSQIKDVSGNVKKLITQTTITDSDGTQSMAKTSNIIDEVSMTTSKQVQSLKDALQKLSGSMVLNSYMTDGAITASRDFEQTSAYTKLKDLEK